MWIARITPDSRAFLPLANVCRVRSLDNAKVFHRISKLRLIDSSPRCVRVRLFLTGWFMTHSLDAARGRGTVARWCALAEQRLEYLTELFETGRWRRFHSELAFLENIQEAKNAVETWRVLAAHEASRDNSPVTVSWPHQNTPAPRRGSRKGEQEYRPQRRAVVLVTEPERRDISIAPVSVDASSDQVPSAPYPDGRAANRTMDPAAGNAAEPVPDLAAIQERYPLLRNAL